MGGAQSTKSTKNLYNCLQLLTKDEIDNQIIEKLKQHYGVLPKTNESIKEIFDYIRDPILIPLLRYSATELDCNLISQFQYFVVVPHKHTKAIKDSYFSENFVKNFRLMNFDTLQNYKEDDEKLFSLLFKGLNNYCQLSKTLLGQLEKDSELWWHTYTILWENYWTHLPHFNNVYAFEQINQGFNKQYPKAKGLSLEFKAEILGAKLWGSNIQINPQILEDFFRSRDTRTQNYPYSRIFNSILDLNIDQYNISFIGDSKVELFMLKEIIENSESIYELILQEKKHLKEYLEYILEDYKYLTEVLPEWYVDRLCGTIFYNCEERIKQQILQYSEKEQTQLIKEYMHNSSVLQEITYPNDFSQIQNYTSQQSTLQLLVNDLFRYNSILESWKTNNTNQTAANDQVLSQISNQTEEQQQQQIGEQVNSDLLGSSISKPASAVHYPNLSLKELKDICSNYDRFKFPIVERQAARDNNVQQRNAKRLKLPKKLHCIFDFTHKNTTQNIVELTTYLSKQQLDYYESESMADLLFK